MLGSLYGRPNLNIGRENQEEEDEEEDLMQKKRYSSHFKRRFEIGLLGT